MKNRKKTYAIGKSVLAASAVILLAASPLASLNSFAATAANPGLESAKTTALNDAGLKAADVVFTKSVQYTDDGVQIYDIEFYSGNKEYEYEISVKSGKILERDIDTYYSRSATATGSTNSATTAAPAGYDWDDDWDDDDRYDWDDDWDDVWDD